MGWLDVGSALVPTWPAQAVRSRVPMGEVSQPIPSCPGIIQVPLGLSLCPCELHTNMGMVVVATWHPHNRKMEQKVPFGLTRMFSICLKSSVL